MSLYSRITNQLQFVVPEFYKDRFFKNLKNLSPANFSERNVEPELIWIKNYLSKNAVILDIGANTGSFLYQLEEKLHHHNIFAFEPNRKLYARLRRIFPKMNIFPLALSDENTFAEFKIPVINGKAVNSRGTLQTQYQEKGEEKKITEKVKVIKLDDWAGNENLRRLDFIKIDVEGNEILTLRGAQKTIKKFKPTLLVEMEQRHHEEKISAYIHEVENWGFEACFLNRETFVLEKISEKVLSGQAENELVSKHTYINNIIFIPKNNGK